MNKVIKAKIRNYKRDIVRYLLEYMNNAYSCEGLKKIDTVVHGWPIHIFELQLNKNVVGIVISGEKYDLSIKYGNFYDITICDDNMNDFDDNDIKTICDVHDRLSDILYNYDNNQNIKHKNELIPKVVKIYELLNDKKHYIDEYVEFSFEDNDFIMTTKFSSEKNIKLLIKDNKIYYTFHGTYVEYDKWTPTALYKINKIVNNLLLNIREIENDNLIKPICNPEEKNSENILLLI